MSEQQDKGRKLTLKRGTEQSAEAPRLEERLHKVLAQAGLGSRRALEQRIADGLVKVNGEVAQVGMSIKGGDKVEIDGRSFVASALTEPSARADVQQARRRSHHARRSRRPPDHLRSAAGPEGRALDRDRPPRHQHHRPAAADHRRRTRQRDDASVVRSRTRIRLPRARAGRHGHGAREHRRPPASRRRARRRPGQVRQHRTHRRHRLATMVPGRC